MVHINLCELKNCWWYTIAFQYFYFISNLTKLKSGSGFMQSHKHKFKWDPAFQSLKYLITAIIINLKIGRLPKVVCCYIKQKPLFLLCILGETYLVLTGNYWFSLLSGSQTIWTLPRITYDFQGFYDLILYRFLTSTILQ